MPVIASIIEQHAEDAAFSWLLRNAAIGEPHYDLADLARLDERVDANLDGLRMAGQAGWDICRDAMGSGEPGEIFVAGVLAFESLVPESMDAVLAAVVGNARLQSALCSALGWIGFDRLVGPVQKLLGADLAFLKRIALSAHAIHRQDPGPCLPGFMADTDPRARSRALKAAGELGRLEMLPLVLQGLQDSDEKCRFYAAWSATLLGEIAAIEKLRGFADQASGYARRACELAVRKMPPPAVLQWLQELAQRPGSIALAIAGYGALGDPQAVDPLIEMMQSPELARPAGEAFAMITGADLSGEDLEGQRPQGFESGPTEDPADEDVDVDPDENLPWPEPDGIRRWWLANKSRFSAGRRYLAGEPLSMLNCRKVLAHGFQRQRMAAALELALASPEQALFETRAPGSRQQRLLGVTP
jgi:uncharacterized protein (TIGR02270 family)